MGLAMAMVVPGLMLAVSVWGLLRKVDLWSALTAGAGEGLGVCARIAPALICLLTAVYMLRASGALELLGQVLGPLLSVLGIPTTSLITAIGTAGVAIGLALKDSLSNFASGAAGERFGGPGGGGGADGGLRPRLPGGTDGGGDAGLHRDHLLHRGGVLRCG